MASPDVPPLWACWLSTIFGVPSMCLHANRSSSTSAETTPAPLGLPAPSQLEIRLQKNAPLGPLLMAPL